MEKLLDWELYSLEMDIKVNSRCINQQGGKKMVREARCKDCGARYAMQTEKMPRAMKCFCESRSFSIIDLK